MSFDALAWAAKCRPGTASRKLVLLALADRHNNEVDGAYPSIAWLVDFTDLNRKTIITCLDALEGLGLISDSGERRGDTKQIKLYRLHIGTVPKTEPSQKRNSPKKVAKQSQKRDTDTVRTKPNSGDKSPSLGRAKFPAPEGVSDEQWDGFVQHRRDHKKGGPLNKRAYTILCNKLQTFAEHGWPPGEMIDRAIDHGWITVFEPTGQDNGSSEFRRTGGKGARNGDGFTAVLREVAGRQA